MIVSDVNGKIQQTIVETKENKLRNKTKGRKKCLKNKGKRKRKRIKK
jgi:hypothetical protein